MQKEKELRIGLLKNLLNLNWLLQDNLMNKNNRNLKKKRRKLPIRKSQRNLKIKPLSQHLNKTSKISYFNKVKNNLKSQKLHLFQRMSNRRMSIQMISWPLWWEVPNYPKSKKKTKKRRSNRKELQRKESCKWTKKSQRKNKRLHSQQTTSKVNQALLEFTIELLNKYLNN